MAPDRTGTTAPTAPTSAVPNIEQTTTESRETAGNSSAPPPHNTTHGSGSPPTTGAQSKTKQANEWRTVGAKSTDAGTSNRKGNVIKIEQGDGKAKDGSATAASSGQQQKLQRGTAAATAIDMTKEETAEEESSSETEADTKDTSIDQELNVVPPPTTQKTKGTGPQRNSNKNKIQYQEKEEEALQRAIHEVQLLKTTTQVEATVHKYTDQYDASTLTKKINNALTHVTPAASRRWILNALDAVLTRTPSTGNCQYNASAEALLQRDLLAESAHKQKAIVDLTTLLKYGMFVSSRVMPKEEQQWIDVSALIDGTPPPDSEDADLTPNERWKKMYKNLALSKSGPRDLLIKQLWGGHDTLRNLSMLLRQKIYVIVEVNSKSAYVQYYYPHKKPGGIITAKLAQPGLEDWLVAIRDDAAHHKTAPVVLSLSNNHYQAVLFGKTRRTSEAKQTHKLKTQTLLDLWAPSKTVDEIIDERKRNPVDPAKSGPTRKELLQQNESITLEELLPVLGQSNWTTVEKQEVVAILVEGATNINELLTFTAEAESQVNSEGELMSADEVELSSSSFELTSQGPAATSSQASIDFVNASGANYRLAADAMWSQVQEEYLEQYPGSGLPDLTETAELTHWATKQPVVLMEVGRWAVNPFILLEHMTTNAIKQCVEFQRQEYLVRRLGDIAATVEDLTVRRELTDWVDSVNKTTDVKTRRAMLKHDDRWVQLNTYAGHYVKGPTALPFVKKEYSAACAFVLILDELFPDLPGRAFSADTDVEPPKSVRMTDVFQYVPRFRSVFTTALKKKSWDPIRNYFDLLRREDTVMEETQY